MDYLGETPATMTAQVERVAEQIEAGAGREALHELLPPGARPQRASTARSGTWRRSAPGDGSGSSPASRARAIVTAYTIGLEHPRGDGGGGRAPRSQRPLLKIKLGDDRPVERIERDPRRRGPTPASWLTPTRVGHSSCCSEVAPRLADLGVRDARAAAAARPGPGARRLTGRRCRCAPTSRAARRRSSRRPPAATR